jgi:hypothetical protein
MLGIGDTEYDHKVSVADYPIILFGNIQNLAAT